MFHYSYILTFPNGKKYIGARSFHLSPELDTTYLGSGRALPKDRHEHRHLVHKEVLACFSTRQELIEFEKNFINTHNCVQDPTWLNLRKSTYDRYATKVAHTTKRLAKSTSGLTLSSRYGHGYRTPAQLDGAKRMREKITGTKNPAKGHSGTTNQAFVPWYYVTPTGEYVEVLNTTKQDKAKELGFTERQLGHGFHYTNEHKVSNRLPRKGWTFGNLPRPVEAGKD